MRIEFVVRAAESGWSVDGRRVEPRSYESRERALSVAENFARAVTARGEAAIVTVVAGGEVQEQRRFEPDIF